MGRWFRFFLGTPQRFIATFFAIAIVVVLVEPGLLRIAVERLLSEISPLVGPVLQLAIVLFGFRIIFSGFCRGGKKK